MRAQYRQNILCLFRPVVLKMDGIAPLGAILRGNGAKKTN